ncbi:MAG: TIGR04222 domain-containing membrane protein [Micromonosporaceae bacterium]
MALRFDGRDLHPAELGYLRAGASGAVAATAAGLSARRLVTVLRDRRMIAVEPAPPADATPLEAAVHGALRSPVGLGDMRSIRGVASELAQLEARLIDSRLLAPRRRGLGGIVDAVRGRRTAAGEELFQSLRTRHADLKPGRYRAAWNAAEPHQVAMSVALYGPEALFALRPMTQPGSFRRSSVNGEAV